MTFFNEVLNKHLKSSTMDIVYGRMKEKMSFQVWNLVYYEIWDQISVQIKALITNKIKNEPK